MIENNVIERLQALFRMAEHKDSNQYEAAIALEHAQAMLLKHNLSRASIDTGTEAATGAPDPVGKVEVGFSVRWETTLLNTVAKGNLCKVIADRAEGKCHLFGARGNVLAVLSMYQWVKEQLEAAAIKDWAAYKRGGGYETARSWRPAFFLGACAVLRDRLAPPLQAFAAGQGRAIVLANDQRVAAAVKSVFPHVSSSRATVNRGSSGYASGRRAGEGVKLGRTAALGYGGQRALSAGGA